MTLTIRGDGYPDYKAAFSRGLIKRRAEVKVLYSDDFFEKYTVISESKLRSISGNKDNSPEECLKNIKHWSVEI